MRETKSREIDGMKFTVQQLGGKSASRLFVRLSSHLFPALSQAAEALQGVDLKGGLQSDLDLGAIGKGLSTASKVLFEKLDENEFEDLLQKLLETSLVKTGKGELPLWPQFDDLMAGKVLTQMKLLAFALEVNFADFLPALGGLSRLAAAGASKSAASNTSSQSGPAGD